MKGLRLTEQEFRDLKEKRVPAAKCPKYGNVKKEVNGITFDSAKEARRYNDLLAWQRSGQITKLETQRAFPIEINGIHVCDYVSDFSYQLNGGTLVVEDAKSKVTRKIALYRLKKRMMEAYYGIEIKEV